MGEVVKKKFRVLKASYVKEADSILLIAECELGRLRHQIPSSSMRFHDGQDVAKEMKKTAEMMVGKNIMFECDPDLLEKLQ